MENPFTVLGITVADAKIIKQLDPKRRQSCLSLMRKYCSSFLHPDINGASHIAMARVNMALDAINTDIGFNQAFKELIKYGPRKSAGSIEYDDTLNIELKLAKIRHGREKQEYRSILNDQNRTIRKLQKKITGLDRLIFRAEDEAAARFRPKIRQLTRNLDEQREANRWNESRLRGHLFKLIERINNNGTEFDIPGIALSIRGLAGMTLEQERGVLKVDNNLDITYSIITRSGIIDRGTSLGKLIGFVSPEIIKKAGELRPGSNSYYDCLFNLQLYFQEGMRPVSIKGMGQDILYVHGPIEKVTKNERKEANNAKTLFSVPTMP